MSKIISIIVAVAENNGIGLENKLLKPISNDLKRFKKLTSGNTVVMGRSTWLSLPNKPLPGRKNIVLTTDSNVRLEGAVVVNSIDEAIKECPEGEESFIIGGAQVYKQFFHKADKIYLTKINESYNADTFFPEIVDSEWGVVSSQHIDDDEKAGVCYSFVDLVRKA